ncbi:MAG: bifunctional metallophosphatase/5'-nucleotidase [candidate division KSB1 bacterium]|nr:bifunctional metallophosphatase/5'-nucleotidase [candidate division KSB1 bacterium]MDZ7369163.1 bifunctional metallophosphatase/5'-nucleotidase [candidate division KSB1 bacterium]MDZ7407142.1 bifunctional metallophosphatase/5'-nucleotidase [candidate division KSB1 bacterium]
MLRFLRGFLIRVGIILAFVLIDKSSLAQDNAKTLTIIHTNDLQSRLLGFAPNREYTPFTLGDDQTIGGIARVATVIKALKQKSPETTLVIDGGDFLMGTLFHTIAREESAELRLLHEIGYEAITLGNHEFDFRPRGLAQILNAALSKGDIPALLAANIVFSESDTSDDALQALFKRGVVKPYQIFVKNGLRIGVFGVMGMNAAEVAPFAAPVTFANPVETAKRIVKIFKNDERVDVIVCASHGGVWRKSDQKNWEGEDIDLAREVPEIDVVVGGHSHTFLKEPIMVNNTPVLQAGAEGRYVGVLNLEIENGDVAMKDYQSIAINDSVAADRHIQAMVDHYQEMVNQKKLRPHGLALDQVFAETQFDLTIKEDNSNLGDLVSDAIRWSIDQYEYNPAFPNTRTVIAVESNGMIRDDLVMGKSGLLQVSDLFRVVPLGIGMVDDQPGFALMSFYLTAPEIKKAFEVLTSVHPLKGWDYFLQISGAKFRYNPNRVIFDRVIDIEIADAGGNFAPLDLSSSNKQLYKAGCNIFVGTFIKLVGDFTGGFLRIVPKDSSGKPIENLNTALVDANPNAAGIQEVKQWVAFLDYVRNFEDVNGNNIPDMPAGYRFPQGRIVRVDSWRAALLYKNATAVTWGASGLILVLLLGLVWLVRLVARPLMKNAVASKMKARTSIKTWASSSVLR